MDIIQKLNWRYATKEFDPNKKLSQEQVETLIEAANLTATSYGMQPCKVVLVENPELRANLVGPSYGQNQVADSSHLLVIARYDKLGDEQVDDFVERMAKTRNVSTDSLEGMSNMIKKFLGRMNEEQKATWSANQAHIILGNLLTVCAELEIDSCPIAGFIPSEYDKILNLEQDNLKSVLVLPVGFRSESDKYATRTKVRMSNEEFLVKR